MIRHICMFKFSEATRKENTEEFLMKAEVLKNIPQIKRFEAVSNKEGTPAGNFDVALIFDFESVSDLENYQVNPIHVEFGKFVATIRESRACIDYEF